MKICSICEEEKPYSEFYSQNKQSKQKGNWVYYNPECKECTKKRSRTWALENPEKAKESNLIGAMHYKRRNREAQREYAAKRRQSGARKEWEQRNRDKLREYALYRSMHKTHEITPEEKLAVKRYFDFKCAYCGVTENESLEKYNNQLHMDHVDPNGANDLSNNIPVCKACNARKHTFSLQEWFNYNDVGFDINRLTKVKEWLNYDYKLYIISRD